MVDFYKQELDGLIRNIKLKVQKDGKTFNSDIFRPLYSKGFGDKNLEVIPELKRKEILSELRSYMLKKISESKEDGDVRISAAADGRYSFYLTKTRTVRRKSSVAEPTHPIQDLKERMEIKSMNIKVNLDELRKKSKKMQTVHFRVDYELKDKLETLCRQEGIKISDYLREVLKQAIQ